MQQNRVDILSKFMLLGTDLEESLKAVSKQTTEGSYIMLKQFETEVAHDFENIVAEFKYKATKISGDLKTSLLESTLCADRKIAIFVSMLSNWLASVREASSVKLSASA